MKLDEKVENFIPPPHPKGSVIDGRMVRLEPLGVEQHAADLFASNAVDTEGKNWVYLAYGPFDTPADYAEWLGQQPGAVLSMSPWNHVPIRERRRLVSMRLLPRGWRA